MPQNKMVWIWGNQILLQCQGVGPKLALFTGYVQTSLELEPLGTWMKKESSKQRHTNVIMLITRQSTYLVLKLYLPGIQLVHTVC